MYSEALAILDHNTELYMINELRNSIKEKDAIITENKATIAAKDAALAENQATIAAKDAALAENQATIAALQKQIETLRSQKN